MDEQNCFNFSSEQGNGYDPLECLRTYKLIQEFPFINHYAYTKIAHTSGAFSKKMLESRTVIFFINKSCSQDSKSTSSRKEIKNEVL